MTQDKKLFILQHSPTVKPGEITGILESRRIPYEIFKVYESEDFSLLKSPLAIVSLGGGMSVNDDHLSWIQKECSFLETCLKQKIPILGICLGGQLLAKTLGAPVVKSPEVELGWWEINPVTKTPMLKGPLHVFEWHNENFQIPSGATLLSKSKAGPNQAFSYGESAYGIQYHPEVGNTLMLEWIEANRGIKEITHLNQEGHAYVQNIEQIKKSAQLYLAAQKEHLENLLSLLVPRSDF